MQKNTAKRWIGFGIVFCLLLLLVCIPFYSLRGTGYQYREVRSKVKEVRNEENDSLDVLFLGDSVSWAAFSPLQLYGEYGYTSYNCGTSGQWTYDSLVLLQEVLQEQEPSVLVLGTSTLYSSPNRVKFALSQYLPVFHYHGYLSGSETATAEANYKGANLSTTVQAYTGTSDYMNSETDTHDFASISEKYLDQVKDLCDTKGIKLILVSAPNALHWTQGKHQAVKNWCTSNNVAYLDYNENDQLQAIGFDWNKDTRDGGEHLNLSGSKKITKSIGAELQKMGTLQDHRQDDSYTKWDTEYASCTLYQ